MSFRKRLGKLAVGLILYSIGIVLTIQANMGYMPWDVFHAGLAKTLSISFGTASILTGMVVLTVVIGLGERFGIGTIANMIFIGIFVDILFWADLIPQADTLGSGTVLLISGLIIVAFATYFYISSGFGAGPRDSLMVAIVKKNQRLSIGGCRALIESGALVVGLFLGGMGNVGTLVCAILIGPIIQIIFSILKFDPKTVIHEDVQETIRRWRA